MAHTSDPTADASNTSTPLAHAIEHIDRDVDSRDCPHECHGSLAVEDDRVLCQSCRCTPDGVYLPPESNTDNTGPDEGCLAQFTWFYPKGTHPKNHRADTWDHDEYRGGDEQTTLVRVRMAGGYQNVYDETHPAGEGSEYEYDISSY